MMTTFYTVDRAAALGCPNPLAAGMIIYPTEGFSHLGPQTSANLSALLPGDYSRHGKRYLIEDLPMTSHAGHPMEIILELLRQRDYPTKPSRLKSAFGCLDVASAKAFRNLNPAYAKSPIFEIEPAHQSAHIADMNLLNISCPAHEYLNKCHLYWQGQPGPSPFWEAVILLPANIGEQVA
ncbi:hypothetical protein RM156_07765 [Pantoea agglomerans]|uniref:hypothetical protein n=1 Tax=Enterobacter agglomerans TaxID=549 RepID=UPI00289D8BE8|nr:hypothetical protein [Pantoea agglomerans]WNK68355.1 hypothetical protein RM156_07765 [Pantoea agglomerans]